MGSDGLDRILTGFYFCSPVGERFNGFRPDFNRFLTGLQPVFNRILWSLLTLAEIWLKAAWPPSSAEAIWWCREKDWGINRGWPVFIKNGLGRWKLVKSLPATDDIERRQTGGFPNWGFSQFFLGKVRIVSRTLSGLFLVDVVNRPRKSKRTNRENPRTIPGQIGKIPEKSGKAQKRTNRKDRQVQIGKPPVWNSAVYRPLMIGKTTVCSPQLRVVGFHSFGVPN